MENIDDKKYCSIIFCWNEGFLESKKKLLKHFSCSYFSFAFQNFSEEKIFQNEFNKNSSQNILIRIWRKRNKEKIKNQEKIFFSLTMHFQRYLFGVEFLRSLSIKSFKSTKSLNNFFPHNLNRSEIFQKILSKPFTQIRLL